MVGGRSRTSSRPATATSHSSDDPHLPSYSEIEDSHTSDGLQAYMTATTTTTVTTTTQTTTLFSLPLWRRRAGPALTLPAKSEGSQPSGFHGRATEDGRIARATSYNVDLNKRLPDIPRPEDFGDLAFARRSNCRMHQPTVQQETERGAKATRSSRSSTLLPSGGQSTRTLAQAGLGIGLPLVMPSAASNCAARKSPYSGGRPSTAPRPTRLETDKEVRRVKSFSRAQTGPQLVVPDPEERETPRSSRKSSTLTVPRASSPDHTVSREAPQEPPSAHPEPRSLTRKGSFWNRRRVQSMKNPDEARAQLQHDSWIMPLPTLPTLQPISPLFPDRTVQSSPASSPRSSSAFRSPDQSQGRHSERSSSTQRSARSSEIFTQTPPAAADIPRRTPGPSHCTVGHRSNTSLQEPQPRPTQTSFVSSPALSRFPVIDQRQSRPRSMTNPPSVLHRLSMGFFTSSSPSTPISSPSVSTNILNEAPVSSQRQSRTLPRSSLSTSTIDIPRPRADEESPEVFLGRLEATVSKAEIANILAGRSVLRIHVCYIFRTDRNTSGDPYYSQALRIYINRFNFTNDPLDIALRKLLMDVGLPKETQQIDRVMEAFAARYSQCNPELFVSQGEF